MTFKYRALDADGDYSFGHSEADFLKDSPAAVAQAVKTRLLLWQGEWFLDLSEGTPWNQQILANSRPGTRDAAIRNRILGTPFVTRILDYASSVDVKSRSFTVSCKIDTAFGEASVTVPFSFAISSPFQIGVSPAGGVQGAG